MPPRSTNSGFTLVESIVAAALIAIALTAVAHLSAIALRQSIAAGRALTALLAAQRKLEHLTAGAPVPGAGDETAEFRIRWTVEPLDPAEPAVVRVAVCSYLPSERGSQPEACVGTVRTIQP